MIFSPDVLSSVVPSHSGKLTWYWKIPVFNISIGNTCSKGTFYVGMLVYQERSLAIGHLESLSWNCWWWQFSSRFGCLFHHLSFGRLLWVIWFIFWETSAKRQWWLLVHMLHRRCFPWTSSCTPPKKTANPNQSLYLVIALMREFRENPWFFCCHKIDCWRVLFDIMFIEISL